ncbi:MAG: ABC transporter ATP-binding protein [Bacteroidales bacterium]|nr:ABC transporter ATP-binding protein [Bacteroidales bacterium]
MIKVENVCKSFGSLEVLKGVDLAIAKGEIVSIVGASGAGKSTLLQIMGSLLEPTSGKVYIDGTDIFSLDSTSVAKFRNSKIGFVFQFHHLLPEFTALENVMLPANIKGEKWGNKALKERAISILNDLGLGERINHKPAQLSGGEQQRVAIARALINNPAVIFADEPSGNLDSRNKEELHKLFFELRDKYGQTIVIVTHETELAKGCDRCIEMTDGRIRV